MTRSELVRAISEGAQALAPSADGGLSADSVERLATLIEELGRWGRRINLTAIRDPRAMVSGHVLDSLAVRPLLHGRRVIDIGTGAGFPGLPLAIVESDREFLLLDANGKKLGFVQHIIGLLGLKNATVAKARAEDYAPGERFDTVIARALAAIARLTELGGHLLGEDGVLLALKGKLPTEELDDLSGLWEYSVTKLKVPGLEDHARHVIVLRQGKGAPA